jgi:hypothetical protein
MGGEVVQRVAVRRELPVDADQGRVTVEGDDDVVPVQIRVEQAERTPDERRHPFREPHHRVVGDPQHREQPAEISPVALSDLLLGRERQRPQKGPAVPAGAGPGGGQRRKMLPAHLRHVREETRESGDQAAVHRLAVGADAGERHALDIAEDDHVPALDQTPRNMRKDTGDRVEDLRLVLPGPDDHGQRRPDPLPHGDRFAVVARHQARVVVRGRPHHVVQVVVPAAERSVLLGVVHELAIRVVRRSFQSEYGGCWHGRTAHGHSCIAVRYH